MSDEKGTQLEDRAETEVVKILDDPTECAALDRWRRTNGSNTPLPLASDWMDGEA